MKKYKLKQSVKDKIENISIELAFYLLVVVLALAWIYRMEKLSQQKSAIEPPTHIAQTQKNV